MAHVRHEDDPVHEGAYHMGPREQAQDFRDRLPRILASQKGTEPQRVLRKLAAQLDDPGLCRWMARLAEEQAARAVEYPPKKPRDIAEFAAGLEMEPSTADELFQIALERLSDIKDEIERGDFSDRGLFHRGLPEKDVQRWLAGRLRRESRNRYSVTREEEIISSDETDIRLHHPEAGYITIEIKPVDSGSGRYSFNQLTRALRNQLVGQYMQATDSRHGVLVVAMLENRHWVVPESRERIEFLELIDRLSHVASEIVRDDNRVDDLRVLGINFVSQ